MTAYVALLRAVNVGGTGKLPMTILAGICRAIGFAQVRTFLASGNVVFTCDDAEDRVRSALEERLSDHGGRRVGVVVRTAIEMAETLARNPFADAPGNRVTALFLDGPLPTDPLEGVTGLGNEQIRLGLREMFVLYPDGLACTRLRVPAEKRGTARNMNTVASLAALAGTLS